MIELTYIKNLLTQKENSFLEFKKAKTGIPKNLYDSICAFSNFKGGEILLGVDDDGTVLGIQEDKIHQLKKDFVSETNNLQKCSPALYLSIEEISIDGKIIFYIKV